MDREELLARIEKFQILIIGLFFSLCIILSTKIISNTLSRSGIEVTGSATEVVRSDYASWDLEINSSAKDKKQAFVQLIGYKNIVMNYLKSKGFAETDIEIKTMNAYPVYKISPETGEELNTVDHYAITQILRVSSKNLNLIKDTSLDAESLLNKGVDIKSNPPAYYYSKISDLKVKLLNAASEDAKKRAKAMLKSTGNHIGPIKSAKTGVFQITAPNSTEVSDYGIYDTSTIDKQVTAVTQVTFRIE